MSVKISNIEKVKSIVLIEFEGICGKGSLGNNDADFIINSIKRELENDKSIQGVIINCENLRYEFGNRFAQIFESNKYKNNKNFYVRIIPNKNDIDNWKSLLKFATNQIGENLIQENIKLSLESIKKQINRKS